MLKERRHRVTESRRRGPVMRVFATPIDLAAALRLDVLGGVA
jgi:hypothetical protein